MKTLCWTEYYFLHPPIHSKHSVITAALNWPTVPLAQLCMCWGRVTVMPLCLPFQLHLEMAMLPVTCSDRSMILRNFTKQNRPTYTSFDMHRAKWLRLEMTSDAKYEVSQFGQIEDFYKLHNGEGGWVLWPFAVWAKRLPSGSKIHGRSSLCWKYNKSPLWNWPVSRDPA